MMVRAPLSDYEREEGYDMDDGLLHIRETVALNMTIEESSIR
jgi:hypothetical protein